MSDLNQDEINEERKHDQELITEEEAESNILSYKTARYLVLFLLVVAIVGFIITFIDFKRQSDKGVHVKYLWFEMNIPKDHPDTVYVKQIVYMDTTKPVHDTVYLPAHK